MGPWYHGQEIDDGSSLGAVQFGSDTALYFREKILRPFLAQYLKDGAPKADVATVTAFETGTNEWRRLARLAAGLRERLCTVSRRRCISSRVRKLGFDAPEGQRRGVSTSTSPIRQAGPLRARPIQPMGYDRRTDLAAVARGRSARGVGTHRRADVYLRRADRADEDQRSADRQPGRLDERHGFRLGGQADRRLSRRGCRATRDGRLSARDRRGHFPRPLSRELRQTASRSPGQPLLYRFALPTANHVFLPGHRIMVQIQSSWFPLYDRNPQTFVPNIFWAKPGDYRKATQRVYHAPGRASFIELPLVEK